MRVVTVATMGDLYELNMSVVLGADRSEIELTELRWHLGLAPRPVRLRIVTTFPVVAWQDDRPVLVDAPTPLLARRGRTRTSGREQYGTLAASSGGPGWLLGARQEIHPDDFPMLGDLLAWLAAQATGQPVPAHPQSGAHEIARLLCREAGADAPLLVRDGQVGWPA